MPRYRDPLLLKDLRSSRKTLEKIKKLPEMVAPTWRTKMIAYYERRVSYLERLVDERPRKPTEPA